MLEKEKADVVTIDNEGDSDDGSIGQEGEEEGDGKGDGDIRNREKRDKDQPRL